MVIVYRCHIKLAALGSHYLALISIIHRYRFEDGIDTLCSDMDKCIL